MRCGPAGTSSSLIIIRPSSEVFCLHIRRAFKSELITNAHECDGSCCLLWERIERDVHRGESVPAKCTNLEARQLFWVQREAKKLEGMTEAELETWPDYSATFPLKPEELFSFANSLFCYSISFLSLLDPAEIYALYFPFIRCLLLILWHGFSQKGVFFCFFFVNLGQDTRVKYAEDGIIGSEAG